MSYLLATISLGLLGLVITFAFLTRSYLNKFVSAKESILDLEKQLTVTQNSLNNWERAFNDLNAELDREKTYSNKLRLERDELLKKLKPQDLVDEANKAIKGFRP